MLMTHNNDDRVSIILAEDDTEVRRSLQLLLLGQGLDVRSHASSAGVLADPSIQDAACLIADYRMPELDGIGLLLALRDLGWKGRSALITGYHSPAVEEQALAAGYDVVLDKPLRKHAFMDAVSRLAAPKVD